MVYAKAPKFDRSIRLQKTIYLWLLDNDHTSFSKLYKCIHADSPKDLFLNLQPLADQGLIYSHPTLRAKNITPQIVNNAKRLNISIKDQGTRALAWALLDYPYLEKVPDEEDALNELKSFARSNRDYIKEWSGLIHY